MPVTHCPHLGLSEDPSLHLSYPDETHRCFASSAPVEIELQHQSRFCLTERHPACPRYVTPPQPVPHQPRPLQAESEIADEEGVPSGPWWRPFLWGTALILLALVVWRYGSILMSSGHTSPASAPAIVSPSPTRISTPQPTPTPVPVPTRVPASPPVALPMVEPTPWPGGRVFTLRPSAGAVGWVASDEERGNHFGDSFLHVGVHSRVIYHSAMQFDLSYIPPGAPIMYAELRLTGLDAQRLGVGGSWELRMLETEVNLGWQSHSYQDIHNAREEQTLSLVLDSSDLGLGVTNVFIFTDEQQRLLEERVLDGAISFRLDGPQAGPNNVFAWDSGYGPASRGNGPILFVSTGPVPPTPTATNTPIPIVVTSTPTPENVLTVAAMMATATAQATLVGTATPTPPNLATPTPMIVVTNTPTPQNAATATAISAYATAVALTTGTFTPMPPNVVTATPTPTLVVVTATPTAPTPENVMTALAMAIAEATRTAGEGTATPLPSNWAVAIVAGNAAEATAISAQATIAALTSRGRNTPTPVHVITATPTPLLIYLHDLTPTPTSTPTPPLSSFTIPAVLKGKIAFLSDRGGEVAVYVMDPDGRRVALLTSRWPYDVALQREPFSPDGNEKVLVRNNPEDIPQLFVTTLGQDLPRPLTAGKSMSYDAVWSPRSNLIAFVSQEPGNDEIFVIQSDGQGRQRLTVNDWEWDKHPTWSPDGTQIAFWSNMETGRKQIWVMNADGSERRNVSKNPWNDWDPVWIK
ncbi:MAG: PD40 domain-containing protein [Chloroflexi bacterium]|nr:PD40 domain-containing protein [Chloroflexota bacterium]